MMKSYIILINILLNSYLYSQNIVFPDAIFKAKLLQSNPNSVIARNLSDEYFSIDENNNGEIEISEALQVSHLNIESSSVSSLAGITNFKNLISIECGNNFISNLNIENLTKLTDLNCNNNVLSSLILTGSTNLQNLYCKSNRIITLDLNNLINLIAVDCSDNQLTTVNLRGLTNLQSFICTSNSIGILNIEELNSLQVLECNRNILTALDFSKLTEVSTLNCSFNRLSSLNVSTLLDLVTLECTNNQLTLLKVDGLSRLITLNCSNNFLTEIVINTLFNITFFNCKNNNLQSMVVTGLGKLKVLDISKNQISTLDINGLTTLQFLYCNNNKLSSLDASNQIGLQLLFVYDNLLRSLFIKNGIYESNIIFSGNTNLNYVCADEDEIDFIQEEINNNGYTNCIVNSYCSFVPGGNYYIVEGKNKLDNNKNGCDALDNNFPNLKLTITDNATSTIIIPDATGNYNYNSKEGTYTIKPLLENPSYYTIIPTNNIITFPNASSPFSAPFCITPTGNLNDLEIILLPLENARSNFNCIYKIIYKNKGTVTQSGAVNLSFETTFLSLVSAIPSISNQSSDTLNWNFTNLLPQETRTILVTLRVNPSVATGYLLNLFTTITNNTDETPSDNRADLHQTVESTINLNDKICLEGNAVSPLKIGDYLHYMIRFENSGTDLISNIVLKDLIDTSKFDAATLVPLSGSHPFYTKISANSAVEFILENIDLPINTGSNTGYIAFKIKTLPTLINGNELTNSATLYFDYQKPRSTNIATTTIQALKIKHYDLLDFFKIYPNPVKNDLNITNMNQIQIDSISIYNILGQIVQTFVNVDSTTSLDVSQLKSGNYVIKINSGDKGTTLRFVKE